MATCDTPAPDEVQQRLALASRVPLPHESSTPAVRGEGDGLGRQRLATGSVHVAG
jgi:hypothetical protein